MSHRATLSPGEGPCLECATAFEHAQVQAPVATLKVDLIGDRLVVAITGELDAGCDQLLQRTLSGALDHATAGLELDLAGVAFCDCSALSVLLRVNRRAHAEAKSLILRATSPAVERLLTLTDTLTLFATEPEPLGGHPAGPSAHERPEAEPADFAGDDLAAENAQLHRAMETRATIDMARGMLMASFQLTAPQSWEVLVTASQHSNTKLHLIADALVQATNGQSLPEPLTDHLAAAVQAHRNSAG
ncbi:ANTAR domain-containing protein [Streptomyces sp. NPDC047022]|uniref:ANTAR domain-containing protein n=1 Tax=Streptomyces sp. NPDC047022 TaxID=3155737 RepID=UPI00340AE29D